MRLSSFGVVALLIFSPIIYAEDGGGSGGGIGGDSRCMLFYDMASKISVELAKLGQPIVSKSSKLVDVKKLREVVMHPLKCIPIHGASSVVQNDPVSLISQLDVDKWDQLPNDAARAPYVVHALLVSSNVEAENENTITKAMTDLLQSTGFIARSKDYGCTWAIAAGIRRMHTDFGGWFTHTIGAPYTAYRSYKSSSDQNKIDEIHRGDGEYVRKIFKLFQQKAPDSTMTLDRFVRLLAIADSKELLCPEGRLLDVDGIVDLLLSPQTDRKEGALSQGSPSEAKPIVSDETGVATDSPAKEGLVRPAQ